MPSTELERKIMFEDLNETVTFTNIDNTDFGTDTWEEEWEEKDPQTKVVGMRKMVHSTDNAAWDGHLYSIKAGEVKVYPKFLAEHLAKHLINKIMGKTNPRAMRNEVERMKLQKQIIGTAEYTINQTQAPKNEGERVAQMVEKLEEEVKPFVGLKQNEDLSGLTRTELMSKAKEQGIKLANTDTKEILIEKLEK